MRFKDASGLSNWEEAILARNISPFHKDLQATV